MMTLLIGMLFGTVAGVWKRDHIVAGGQKVVAKAQAVLQKVSK